MVLNFIDPLQVAPSSSLPVLWPKLKPCEDWPLEEIFVSSEVES